MKKAEKIVSEYKKKFIEKKEGFCYYDELPYDVEDIENALWEIILATRDSKKLKELKKLFVHLITYCIPDKKKYKEYISVKKTVDDAYKLIEVVKTKNKKELKKY
ncbi:hypothetical protein K8R62_01890 [bacterium]|nr:hypothetical protein [bacterium]